MIGIIPTVDKTFEVEGEIHDGNWKEGYLYYDLKDNGRLYYYSTKESRSNPRTGWFPIYNGKEKIESRLSCKKYYPKDIIFNDINNLANKLSKEISQEVSYRQRKSTNGEILRPTISDGDNLFTQCIKGVINKKQLTMVDLLDSSSPVITEAKLLAIYSALNKINFMRTNKWLIWIDLILHLHYVLKIYKDDKLLLTYEYPSNKFDTGLVKYNDITKLDMDPFKKIIKILMLMENITKTTLRNSKVDDYTINNMMTTINSAKVVSAQIFSRFIDMAGLSYEIKIYDENNELVFEFQE